ncbi:MAG: cytidine deaminase [Sulfobacillus thermosulfidooxidans]|uniref:Cytidine deaminase n=1 Tax=Sulfobacillus thermotolerans TaxID=338644 RepID=A0ABN5GXE7_9FIRM|nr:cytidine deaminase [Sulfobacillus thermotolerans]MCY0906866.1 cytidine deaminase [Sulfobacillus thermotolerans]PSR36984.1 MAG: cytidine deaminase [Sulfobacillus thermosulfidooxidans]
MAYSLQELKEQARQVRDRAYVPYSHFPVGAALVGKDGQIFSGCNVENASYPLGMCAERACVSMALAAGVRSFEAIWIMGERERPMPCGGCRQVLSEFGDLQIFVASGDGDDVKSYWLHDLLPESFHWSPTHPGELAE